MTSPSAHARTQYATTTGNLSARIAIYDYSTNPQDWYSWVGERLRLDGRVLEVGAGTGALWSRVEPPAGLTLVDFSAAMCAGLRLVPGARVVRAGATELPFADGTFDGLIANHMLYHLDDPAAGLREFARVLRPGGRLAVSVNGRDHLAEIDALLPRQSVLNGVSAETVSAYVGQVFDDVGVERYPCSLEIPDAEPVLRYLASRNPAALTPEAVARIREQVAAEGVFRVRQHAVLVTATAR
ncbi:methyltransferase domain-containing protein [Actinoplanes sp. Pm04-4]|uniref:Methyltransferase domain-containing protein n=1 Tax=Paractinoplanes pyxinae TaxID=2997416 RepID=A0ABT4AZ08_9ACTN|nr:methyltransferase domain-containing protein [Actinoplanes pyxinae]MCY1139462.1 methyltransferase domain-containing protein [Actinoplanes pyxinae]